MALREDEQYVYDRIEHHGGMTEIEESVSLIIEYRKTDFFERKNNLIAAWEIDYKNIYDLVISVFTATLTADVCITMQALIGMLNHKIKLDNEIDRVTIIADIIGLISTTGLIDILSEPGEYHSISTEYELSGIPKAEKHITVTLRPQPVEDNWGILGSVILGHNMNHHDRPLRLSHLERMGQIPFKVNAQFIDEYDDSPKHTLETEEQRTQWYDYSTKALQKAVELTVNDHRFFVPNGYCSRGRSYSRSYYLNPQGTDYQKAAIVLADKEIVEGF